MPFFLILFLSLPSWALLINEYKSASRLFDHQKNRGTAEEVLTGHAGGVAPSEICSLPALDERMVPEPVLRSLIGREPGREPGSFGRIMAKTGKGFLGLLIGLVLGAFLGAAGGGLLAVKSINPAIKRWRPLLLAPAIFLGAIFGQVYFPYLLAKLGMDARSYPKIPEEKDP